MLNKATKKEINKLVSIEVEKRPNGIVQRGKKFFAFSKYFSLIYASYYLVTFILKKSKIIIDTFEYRNDFYYIIGFSESVVFVLLSHLLTLRYNKEKNPSKDIWLRKLHLKFIPVFVLGLVLFLILAYSIGSHLPLYNLILLFIIISLIGFFSIVALIYTKLNLFTNNFVSTLADFFYSYG